MQNEIVLVDNNSTEESGVRQYLDTITGNANTVNVIRQYNSKNLGVGAGRNSGLIQANGDFLATIDDDVLIPDHWDVKLAEACTMIPKLGITGVNVEPVKYPVQTINGIRVRPKNGNLGGACLCLPRRILSSIGYYRVFGQYGLEDSDYYVRLKVAGLMSAYIEPKGIHLDTDKDKAYRAAKTRAQTKGSIQIRSFAAAKAYYEKTRNVYVPYTPYDPDAPEWSNFESMDGTLTAKIDLRKLLDLFDFTKGMKLGNKTELIKSDSEFLINSGAETRKLTEEQYNILITKFEEFNILYSKQTNLG